MNDLTHKEKSTMTSEKSMSVNGALSSVQKLMKKSFQEYEALKRLSEEFEKVLSMEKYLEETVARTQKKIEEAEEAEQKAEKAKTHWDTKIVEASQSAKRIINTFETKTAAMAAETDKLERQLEADKAEAEKMAALLVDLKSDARAKLEGLA